MVKRKMVKLNLLDEPKNMRSLEFFFFFFFTFVFFKPKLYLNQSKITGPLKFGLTMLYCINNQVLSFLFLVTVAGVCTGKRNFSKPDYCLYCRNRYTSKISSHYLAVHDSETRVKKIKELPLRSKERKRQMLLLQNEGNHLHNCQVR